MTLYSPSPWPFSEPLPPVEYPGHYETRKVDHTGMIRWKNERIFISRTLEGETIAFEEIDKGIWSVYYSTILLARFDARERKFHT